MKPSCLFIFISLLASSLSAQTFRWDVKTLTDNSGIDWMQKIETAKQAHYASIEGLTTKQIQYNSCSNQGSNTRRSDEKRVVKLRVRLIKIKKEGNDNDYHIVMQSLKDTAIYMVAEIPDPTQNVFQSSQFADLRQLFAQLRDQAKTLLGKNVTETFKNFPGNTISKIYGVPFWDCKHPDNVKGASVDFREIHPVLKIE